MKKQLLTIFLSLIIISGFSQEIISGLAVNPVLQKNHSKSNSSKSKQNPIVTVQLPFIDDFSYNSMYPSDSLWLDKYAFINRNYPYDPPTIGVATLDAINDTGGHYLNAGAFPFLADSLTSQYIRLDSIIYPSLKKISIADSIYLSFYYQPQGLGNYPNTDDSLILEFFTPIYNKWKRIWGTSGSSLSDFYDSNGTYFKWIMIPILDTAYLTNQFQFRFKNYASLANNNIPSWSGNVDHWNIDYVYLDINRFRDSNNVNDVAFSENVTTLLKNYEEMPWKQFIADSINSMKDSVLFRYENLSNTQSLTDRRIIINDLSQTTSGYVKYFSANINPKTEIIYYPKLNYTYKALVSPNDYPAFEVKLELQPSADLIPANDDIIFYQKFYNYYAYDDGSPEAGYGLSPSGAKLAYQFKLNTADTLQSIQMYFNQTNTSTQLYFYLTVWDDNGGVPGNVIYEQAGVSPVYTSGLNEFHTYVLDNPVAVSGKFYIGWRQTSNDNLNIGFDKNTNTQTKIFHNTIGSWNNSLYEGSLMIRPILGSELYPHLGIKTTKKNIEFKLYPNPVNDGILNIELSTDKIINESKFRINVYNIIGKEVLSTSYKKFIDVSSLNNGIYFVKIINIETKEYFTSKIIVAQ
ncbi:MAG: T9SS type A sorting domain-containing protein [Saprospiraceae bacterium]|nr:T9SS type A sorting domain-containing protein [Saprospiraceae bacterium]